MKELHLLRTDAHHPDFFSLVRQLDADLLNRYGAAQSFYDQFNKLHAINHVVVAYSEDAAVGCGAFKPFGEETVEIKRMYVSPAQRGQGIGKKILSELEQWALTEGNRAAVLETGIRQPEAIRMYQSCGYYIIDNYGQYVGVEDSVCMRKEL